ncbi:stalk domain-containing protein [Paenibacillus oleatilyticus]|uniref:Stalk domain-containing protein n=1 Tax=Paenibacillus oleatilyticus TaxID=2594886 RepID=A0ABV4V8S9_9BACL
MKKLIIGLSVGMLLGSAATALAATNETVQATFAKFVFKVNGQERQLQTTPLVVDGTSYLPVREISGLLGYELKYDEATREINLTGVPGVPAKSPEPPATASEVKSKENSISDGIDSATWISAKELVDKGGIKISVRSDGKEFYLTKKDQTFTLTQSNGDIMIKNDSSYLKRDTLKNLGLID